MSTVVGAWPPRIMTEEQAAEFRSRLRKKGASWWRLRLLPNEDGLVVTEKRDESDVPMWMSWEFYDGHGTYIDGGLDSPTLIVMHQGVWNTYLDVASVEPPTPCPRWRQLGKVDSDPLVFPELPFECPRYDRAGMLL